MLKITLGLISGFYVRHGLCFESATRWLAINRQPKFTGRADAANLALP
jgi:hypothetical protein